MEGEQRFPEFCQVVLDSTNVRQLAEFYRQLLDLRYRPGDEPSAAGSTDKDWLVLRDRDGRNLLAFQQVSELAEATWPDGPRPQQLHLDLTVPTAEDVEVQHGRALALGARLLYDRFDDPEEPLRVYADPAGTPSASSRSARAALDARPRSAVCAPGAGLREDGCQLRLRRCSTPRSSPQLTQCLRVGLIYFHDQQSALTGRREALRPGGRISAVIYSTADRNGFFSVPIGIIRRQTQLPPPAPRQPEPFSLGAPGVAEEALARAGFRDITADVVPSPFRMASAARLPPYRTRVLRCAPSDAGRAAADRAGGRLGRDRGRVRPVRGPDGFTGPCEMLVVSATR